MSKTIDTRIVSMQFDNRHFESNVQTSLSTLDKLKQKLNLTGASKGLDNLSTAAARVNLNPIGAAAEAVGLKFNAMHSMADQALRNITNTAMMYGKRIVSALTIDPIKTGLSEYETKMNAIQVIQANTRDKNSMEDITKALDELNTYADKTIYNFAQMTSNMGKFTAQGFDVYESANAVKGLANLAAASGASAEDMARATYQMSQSLGSTIKLIDWNSLRNANMATQDLKNTLIDLAKVNGIAIDDMIEKHGSFEQTLSEGWLSGKMFSEAMNIYSGVYTEAELKAKGFTDAQVKNFMELAATAESAATEVKTFTQLWDVLKETAQSGWTQTWEILFGDFATAKKMFTNLQVYFSDIINGWSDIRNNLLGGALNMKNPWSAITDKLEKSGLGKLKEVANVVETVTDKLEYFQEVVNKVWRGDFGNSDTGRYEKLKAAGYDHRVVQDLVNKGYQYKITMEDIEASHKKFGLTMDKTATSTKDTVDALGKLSDEQLRNAGLTEGEIRLYRDLEAEAKRTGKTIDEVAKEMSETDGRTLIIETIKNAWSGLVSILKSVKEAWNEVFPPMSVVRLYSIIKQISEFSARLKVGGETAEKIKRTFKGLFAILDIITTLTGGGLKIALKLVGALIGDMNIDLLSLTAKIGDAIVSFRDWIDETIDFNKVFKFLLPYITRARDAISKWIAEMRNSGNIPKFLLTSLINGLKKVAKGVGKIASQIGDFIIEGLKKGLTAGIKKVAKIMYDLGSTIIDKICEVLGIHSPSRKFFEIGKNIIQGLVNGIKAGADLVWRLIKTVGEKCIEVIQNLDLGKVFAAAVGVGLFIMVMKILDLMKTLATPVTKFSDVLENVSEMFDSISKSFKASAMKKKSQAVVNFAIAIAILAGSIALLTLLPVGKMWSAVGAIAVLAAVVVALAIAVDKISKNDSLDGKAKLIDSQVVTLIGIAASILIVAVALKKLSEIDTDRILPAIGLLGVAIVAIGGLYAALTAVTYLAGPHADKIGGMLLKMAVALIVLIAVIKLASKLRPDEALRGLVVVGILGWFFAAIIAVSYLAGEHATKAGSMMLKMSFAILMMVGVVKLAARLDIGEIKRGITAVGMIELLFAVMIAVSKIAGDNAGKAGSMMLKMSFAILMMVGIVKLISFIDDGELIRGLAAVGYIELLFAAIIGVSYFAGEHADKAGKMLLTMSIAMGILTALLYVIGNMDTDVVARGLHAVTSIMALFGLVMYLSKDVGDIKLGILITMTVAIGILMAALVALSFADPKKLYVATIAISAVLGMLAIIIDKLIDLSKVEDVSGKALWNLVGVLAVLAVIVGALGLVLGILAKNGNVVTIEQVGSLALLMGVLAGVALLLRNAASVKPTKGILNPMGLWQMVGVIAVLAAIVAALGFVLGILAKNDISVTIEQVGSLSLLMAALGLVASTIAKVPNVNPKSLWQMVGVIAVLAAIVAALGLVLGLLSKYNLTTSFEQVGALTLMLIVMTGVVAALAAIGKFSGSIGPILKGLAGIGILLGGLVLIAAMVGGFAAIPGNVMKNGIDMLADLCTKMLKPLYAALPLIAILTIVGMLPVSSILKGVASLGILLGGLVLIAAMVGGFSAIPGDVMKNGIDLLADLCTQMMGPLYSALPLLAVLSLIGLIPVHGILLGLAALGILLAGLAVIALGVGALTLIPKQVMIKGLGALRIIVYTIEDLGDMLLKLGSGMLLGAAGNSATMSLQLYALVGLIAILGIIALAIGGLVTLIPGGEAVLDKGLEIITNIGNCLMKMGNSLAKVAQAMPSDMPFITHQLGAMEVLIAALGVIALALGSFAEIVPGGEGVLDTGLKMVKKIASIIIEIGSAFADAALEQIGKITGEGGMIAEFGTVMSNFMTNAQVFFDGAMALGGNADAILAGVAVIVAAVSALTVADFIDGMTAIFPWGSSLVDLGTHLSRFAKNAQGFIDVAKGLDEGSMNGIKSLVSAIALLTAVSFVEGISRFVIGIQDIETFGKKLPSLGTNIKDFVENLGSNFDSDVGRIRAMNGAAAVKAIAQVAESIPGEGGWWQKIIGTQDVEAFASKLPAVATYINAFTLNLGKNFDNNAMVARAKNGAAAIKALAEVAEGIPGEGGWLQKIVGQKDIESFAKKLPAVATYINAFTLNLGKNFDDKAVVARAKNGASVIKALATVAEGIPNEGGWWQKIVGTGDIQEFAGKLPAVGAYLRAFIGNLGKTFDDTSVITRAENAAKVVKVIADVAATIPGDATWWEKLLGKDAGDLETFAGKIGKLGEGLKSFIDKVKDLSSKNVVSVAAAVDILNALSKINGSVKNLSKNLPDLGDSLAELGEDISSFASSVGGTDQMYLNRAINNITSLTDMLKGLDGLTDKSASAFKESLTDLAETSVSKVISAFTDTGAKDKIKNAALGLFGKVVEGIEAKKSSVKTAASNAVKEAYTTIKNIQLYTDFWNAGGWLVEGFAKGISANTYQAEAKAEAMAKAAKIAAEKALGIQSPSKEFYKVGAFAGMGFANALGDYADTSYDSASAMADSARRGLTDAVSKIRDAINGDLDVQPTIRPVVDLSEVTAGAGAMNRMLSLKPSVGVLANVRSINSAMNRRNQNGTNNDIISAIKDLKETVNRPSGDTYNFEGITYDDGSNISEAVQTLVRAAKVERRK